MKTVGYVKSDKENENRIALYPNDLKNIKYLKNVYIEKDYGKENGIADEEYMKYGANVISRQEVLQKDIIIDPKIGDAQYLKTLQNKIIFGWVHAIQNRHITDIIVNNSLTAFAWEDMFKDNRHVFWRNNEIAGEAAVMHALLLHGFMPYDKKAAILGNGNTARGAYKILTGLGADVKVYGRKMEKLFRDEVSNFDIIVNAVLWDVNRNDHILYNSDLKRMRQGSLIIDISCDNNGAIESSCSTTINDPIFIKDGVTHYAVDHTPSLLYKTVSKELSSESSKFIDELITGEYTKCLSDALIIKDGKIIDNRIKEYQKRS